MRVPKAVTIHGEAAGIDHAGWDAHMKQFSGRDDPDEERVRPPLDTLIRFG